MLFILNKAHLILMLQNTFGSIFFLGNGLQKWGKKSRRKTTKYKYGYSQREKTAHENFSVYTEIKQLKFDYSPVKK